MFIIDWIREKATTLGLDDVDLIELSRYFEVPALVLYNAVIVELITALFYAYVLLWGWVLDARIFWFAPACCGIMTFVALLPCKLLIIEDMKTTIIATVAGWVFRLLIYIGPILAVCDIIPKKQWWITDFAPEVKLLYILWCVVFGLLTWGKIPKNQSLALRYALWKSGTGTEAFDEFVSRRKKYHTAKADLELMKNNLDIFSSRFKNGMFVALMCSFLMGCYLPHVAESLGHRKSWNKRSAEKTQIVNYCNQPRTVCLMTNFGHCNPPDVAFSASRTSLN